MRLHRFIEDFDLSKKEIVVDDADFLNQIKNVLRLNIGDKLILCDGHGNEAISQIIRYSKSNAMIEIIETKRNENEPKNHVHLYCPILKKENFEWTVQKAVEVGVKELTPVITARTVKLGLNYERLNKIIKESAEQSGRVILPKLNEAMDFGKAFETAKNNNDLNLFFQIGYSSIVHKAADRPKCVQCKIGVFVGPEGGWTDEEIEKARAHNFVMAGLGKTILRAETAAVVASYIAVNF